MKELPYYTYHDGEDLKLEEMPWHHVFFNQYKWYHKIVGGNWKYVQLDETYSCWMRFR